VLERSKCRMPVAFVFAITRALPLVSAQRPATAQADHLPAASPTTATLAAPLIVSRVSGTMGGSAASLPEPWQYPFAVLSNPGQYLPTHRRLKPPSGIRPSAIGQDTLGKLPQRRRGAG